MTTEKPEAADVFSVDDTWVCCTGRALIGPTALAWSQSNNKPGFFVKLKITNDEFLARTEIRRLRDGDGSRIMITGLKFLAPNLID